MPTTRLPQDEVRRLLYGTAERSRLAQRLTDTVFAASGVETRHLFLAQVDQDTDMGQSFLQPDPAQSPSTSVRNELAVAESRRLAADAASAALATADFDAQRRDARDHRLVHRVLGAGNRHPLVRDLGLPAGARRVHIGFMGCCAAFPALATARSIAQAEPDAVILVVCVEVCSLHLKVGEGVDEIVASSLFADGCAAMIVSARAARSGAVVLEIDDLGTALASTGEQDLTWSIGDNGFEMVLSPKVPRVIEAEVRGGADAPRREGVADGRLVRVAANRPLGSPPRRASHSGPRGEGARAAPRTTRALARHPSALRQHVERNGSVHPEEASSVTLTSATENGCAPSPLALASPWRAR